MVINHPNNSPDISIIIPVYNASEVLRECLMAVISSSYSNFECIVVDDGSKDDSQQIAREFGVQIIIIEQGPMGPANARNRGAREANGEIIFFIDSDVVIKPDTLQKVARSFIDHPEYHALFGSYDNIPGDGQFLSVYKNLSHHYVHQRANREGATFWTGCGAIRRDVFLKMGGFDYMRYPRPSIEDIEFGARLRVSGYKILVDPEIQVKHLKRWTLLNLLKTDVLNRGIPWTSLILQEHNLPNDLNLDQSQRLSALLLILMLVDMGVSALFASQVVMLPLLVILFLVIVSSWQIYGGNSIYRMGNKAELLTYSTLVVISILAFYFNNYALLLPLGLLLMVMIAGKLVPAGVYKQRRELFNLVVISFFAGFIILFISFPFITFFPIIICTALILWLNRQYYTFFARLRGPVFALAVYPFQLFYYFYSLIAFAGGYGLHLRSSKLRSNKKSESQG